MKRAKLEKVQLRKVWKHEALDFTNWLAKPENLSLLGSEININIALICTEASVGRFNVDILAEEEETNRKIVIENQLEQTDHDHLGKIITYASGFDAEIIIWIVKNIRDEHKKAIDWLNERTDEKANFFAVELEVWQINDSPYAAKFQVISQPNNWAKVVKNSVNNSNRNKLKMLYLEYWESFRNFATNKGINIKIIKPHSNQSYLITNSVYNQYRIALTTHNNPKQIACELFIPDSKDLFDKLAKSKNAIETDLGFKLNWTKNFTRNKKACRINIFKNANIKDISSWEKHFEWFLEKAEAFNKVFPKYIKNK